MPQKGKEVDESWEKGGLFGWQKRTSTSKKKGWLEVDYERHRRAGRSRGGGGLERDPHSM